MIVVNGTAREISLYMNTVWMVQASGGFQPYSGVENPLIVMAQSLLGLDKNRIKNASDPTEGFYIKNVTQCAFTFCVEEYNVNVISGNVIIEKPPPDFGKTENITLSSDGTYSTSCWVPSSQTPKDAKRHYEITSPEGTWIQVTGPQFTYCNQGNVLVKNPFIGSSVDDCFHRKSGWE